MKSTAQIFVYFLVICNLLAGLQAGLFQSNNGVIYCKWSNRGICDKRTAYCVQIPGTPMGTCKNYKNECQYLIDNCLGKTMFGRMGTPVAAAMCSAIAVGAIGTC